MNVLLTPQPNQAFWHVPPAGNSYHSDAARRLIPLTDADENALIALGCTVEEGRARLAVWLPPDQSDSEDAPEDSRRSP